VKRKEKKRKEKKRKEKKRKEKKRKEKKRKEKGYLESFCSFLLSNLLDLLDDSSRTWFNSSIVYILWKNKIKKIQEVI